MNTPRLRRVITEGYELLEKAVGLSGMDPGLLKRARLGTALAEHRSRGRKLDTGRCMHNVGVDLAAMSIVTVRVVEALRAMPVVPKTWYGFHPYPQEETLVLGIAESLLRHLEEPDWAPENIMRKADFKLVMQKMLTHVSGNVDYTKDIAC